MINKIRVFILLAFSILTVQASEVLDLSSAPLLNKQEFIAEKNVSQTENSSKLLSTLDQVRAGGICLGFTSAAGAIVTLILTSLPAISLKLSCQEYVQAGHQLDCNSISLCTPQLNQQTLCNIEKASISLFICTATFFAIAATSHVIYGYQKKQNKKALILPN